MSQDAQGNRAKGSGRGGADALDDALGRESELVTRADSVDLDSFGATASLPDRYRLNRVLGKGGFGIVYLAHDKILEQDVAIKVMKIDQASEIDRKRFLFEARTGAKLRHPGIVNVFDIIQTESGLQLIMEYYPGGTISDLIKRDGPIRQRRALEYTRQVAVALAYAHKKQIIHRDIKPANMFLAGDDDVKLGDFGIAARYEGHDHTSTGQVMGTPIYMAPEQYRDSKDVDPRADIYSLGMALYHMLSGRPPRVVELDPFEGAMKTLLRRATAHDRSKRPVSSEQLIALIDHVLEETQTKSVSTGSMGAAGPLDGQTHPAPPELMTETETRGVAPAFGPIMERPAQALADSDTLTRPPGPPPSRAGAAGSSSSQVSWSIVALVGVMVLGFVTVIFMVTSNGDESAPASVAQPAASAEPTPLVAMTGAPGRGVAPEIVEPSRGGTLIPVGDDPVGQEIPATPQIEPAPLSAGASPPAPTEDPGGPPAEVEDPKDFPQTDGDESGERLASGTARQASDSPAAAPAENSNRFDRFRPGGDDREKERQMLNALRAFADCLDDANPNAIELRTAIASLTLVSRERPDDAFIHLLLFRLHEAQNGLISAARSEAQVKRLDAKLLNLGLRGLYKHLRELGVENLPAMPDAGNVLGFEVKPVIQNVETH